MVRVKICGITSSEDAGAAIAAGADALGFVFAKSPRRVNANAAREIIKGLPPFISTVGVFVNGSTVEMIEIKEYCGLDILQLHGDEPEAVVDQLGKRVIKAIRIADTIPEEFNHYPNATLLLDTYNPGIRGGTGESFDWNVAAAPARDRPIILAGGLSPDNVAEAVKIVNPYAVDVSSGVESIPGRKNYERMELFIRRAKLSK